MILRLCKQYTQNRLLIFVIFYCFLQTYVYYCIIKTHNDLLESLRSKTKRQIVKY